MEKIVLKFRWGMNERAEYVRESGSGGSGRVGRPPEALLGLLTSSSGKAAQLSCDHPGHVKLISRCLHSGHPQMPGRKSGMN